MAKYTIGLDFGTLSGRSVLADVSNGTVVATEVFNYPHAVISEDERFGKLPDSYALQDPADYLETLDRIIPPLLVKTGISKEDVIGIAIDFTSSTVLPVDKDGTPLCFKKEFVNHPQAYVKLWKDHGANEIAANMTKLAIDRKESWLPYFGGQISSETAMPKLLNVFYYDREVYNATYKWIEACDWMIFVLTGNLIKSAAIAGFKCLYNGESYPSKDYFKAIDPGIENIIAEKIELPFAKTAEAAGYLTKEMSERLGLTEGIPVASGIIDAHAGVPAAGIASPGKMFVVLGTSACAIITTKELHFVKGTLGTVLSSTVPGLYSYESGQSCVGDMFSWFVDRISKDDSHAHLSEEAEKLKPGESGLLALDWFNGNRSPLSDFDLTGNILGITMNTRPCEIYRALIESAAFGMRRILDIFKDNGIDCDELFFAGGISIKNKAAMQWYADILKKPIHVLREQQSPALGTAIYAAVAAGSKNGGYDSLSDAAEAMKVKSTFEYAPIPENASIYDKIYEQYINLSDIFSKAESPMKEMLKIKKVI